MPPEPALEVADRRRMKHPVYLFELNRLLDVGDMVGRSVIDRLDVVIMALAVQTWHVHLVVGATRHDVGEVVKCAKEAVRYGLRPGRPIWSGNSDKRFCFDGVTLHKRVRYVERHNEAIGWPHGRGHSLRRSSST